MKKFLVSFVSPFGFITVLNIHCLLLTFCLLLYPSNPHLLSPLSSLCVVAALLVPTRWQVSPCWHVSWLRARRWSPTSSSTREAKSDLWRSRATTWGMRWPGGEIVHLRQEEVFEPKTVGTWAIGAGFEIEMRFTLEQGKISNGDEEHYGLCLEQMRVF